VFCQRRLLFDVECFETKWGIVLKELIILMEEEGCVLSVFC
jgi:hypothetical protein